LTFYRTSLTENFNKFRTLAHWVVYYGNNYPCYARARHRALRDAERVYVERLHWAVGRADMPSFSDFQKLISRYLLSQLQN